MKTIGREGVLKFQILRMSYVNGPFVVVVDGDDVGLGVDVRVGRGDGVEQVGHGGEDVLEGDLEEEISHQDWCAVCTTNYLICKI